MSDDPVKQSIAELQDLVRCRCHPAYTGRGMHDPDCECDSADAVQVVTDRIEELEAKLDLSEGALDVASKSWGECQRILEQTQAKLAKAVSALGVFSDDRNWFDVRDAGADPYDGRMYAAWRGPADEPEEFARTTLAELKRETDE